MSSVFQCKGHDVSTMVRNISSTASSVKCRWADAYFLAIRINYFTVAVYNLGVILQRHFDLDGKFFGI